MFFSHFFIQYLIFIKKNECVLFIKLTLHQRDDDLINIYQNTIFKESYLLFLIII